MRCWVNQHELLDFGDVLVDGTIVMFRLNFMRLLTINWLSRLVVRHRSPRGRLTGQGQSRELERWKKLVVERLLNLNADMLRNRALARLLYLNQSP
jgi:hypothetical protein